MTESKLDHTEIHLTGCEFEGLHKYAAAMKCKVGPVFVKGRNVLLPYICSNKVYKYESTNMQQLRGALTFFGKSWEFSLEPA